MASFVSRSPFLRQAYRPTINTWNRIEGRPRSEDFVRATKAEVRDALWMLSKQWQMGEFIGDDAGSPVLARVHMETTTLNKYQAGGGETTALEQDIPLEVKVEHQKIPFEQGQLAISLDLRLLMGRQWLKWIDTVDSNLRSDYIGKYFVSDPDPAQASDAGICAHVKAWQQFSAVAGRSMDGYKLYEHLENPAHHGSDDIAGITTDLVRGAVDVLGEKFVAWFDRVFYQPGEEGNPSWKPSYLEHQFSCSAPQGDAEKVLTADEYYHGHLDWYNLDIDPAGASLGDPVDVPADENVEGALTHTFIPTSVSFGGMPDPRWWAFEDSKTDLSFVRPDTTDLNKLLLLDFILVYSNDWFIVPFTLPTGTLANIRGLMVTNVFGERTWVTPAGSGADEDWDRWSMYTLNVRGTDDVPADLSHVVLPTARKVSEGKPVEEIFLVRDEIANMVWGVESRVPLATGRSKSGNEAGHELKAKLQQLLEPTSDEVIYRAGIRYQVVNSVPEHWIPLIPVHVDENQREIQLQRAAMPRILENDPAVPKKVEPRTSLLREGLDEETKQKYLLHEEEVSKVGIRVHKSFQRTRWYDGKVFNWLGIRKQVGRGGGRSGLAFDQILPVKNANSE